MWAHDIKPNRQIITWYKGWKGLYVSLPNKAA
jgi:hypothetical protein